MQKLWNVENDLRNLKNKKENSSVRAYRIKTDKTILKRTSELKYRSEKNHIEWAQGIEVKYERLRDKQKIMPNSSKFSIEIVEGKK